jgi:hypothetical protein
LYCAKMYLRPNAGLRVAHGRAHTFRSLTGSSGWPCRIHPAQFFFIAPSSIPTFLGWLSMATTALVCQLAVEVGATWLLQYIEGRVKLPRRTAMMERFARNSSCANACYRPRSARQFTPPRSSRLPRSHRAHHRRGLNDTSDRPLRLDEREAHLEQSSP